MDKLIATMEQIAPNTWAFQLRPMAPMKGTCQVCNRAVGILDPHGTSLPSGTYMVSGQCESCHGEVSFVVA